MNEQQMQEMTASEVQQRLLDGKSINNAAIAELQWLNQTFASEIHFNNCRIGRLTIQNCQFQAPVTFAKVVFEQECELNVEPGQTVFAQKVSFDGCRFMEALHGRQLLFHEAASWEQVEFCQRVSFANAQFLGNTSFKEAKFLETSRFEDALFQQTSFFVGALFQGKANFKKAQFPLQAYFRKAIFAQGATFENATFFRARFEDMHAKGKMVFKVVTFSGRAYFHRAQFEDELNFRGCEIKDHFYLRDLHCHKHASFSGTEAFAIFSIESGRFDAQADFSKCIFHHDVYLRESIFSGNVDFAESIFAMRLDCSQVQFRDAVKLYSANPNTLLVERRQLHKKLAAEREKNYEQARQVYAMLRRNFEQQGNHEDADWAYYNFRKAERKAQKASGLATTIYKFCNWLFFDLGSGYGTKPFNVALLAAMVILAFTVIFWMASGQFVIDPSLRAPGQKGISPGQAFYLSAMTFTTLGTEGIAPEFDNWLKYCLVLEGFLGLFLMTVFVGVYTRKMAK